jgi:UDP-N-acetylmuramoyl-L-alanyl-D-glutamate--2,6-diaminopimelate ligase
MRRHMLCLPDLRARRAAFEPRGSTIAARFFDAPSQRLTIAGITGTNGKTTCAYLLAQALSLCGRRAAYMGTLGYGLPVRSRNRS